MISVRIKDDGTVKVDIDEPDGSVECSEADAFIRAALVALGVGEESLLDEIEPIPIPEPEAVDVKKKLKT